MGEGIRRWALLSGAVLGIGLLVALSLAWWAAGRDTGAGAGDRERAGAGDRERAGTRAGAGDRLQDGDKENPTVERPRAQMEGCIRDGDDEPEPILLPGPDETTRDRLLADLVEPPRAHRWRPPADGYGLHAQATEQRAPVYANPTSRVAVSDIRRGRLVRVKPARDGLSWYAVRGGGFISPDHGFRVAAEPEALPIKGAGADTSAPLPYRYGKLHEGALRHGTWPPRISKGGAKPDHAVPVQGAVFAAIAGRRLHKGQPYVELLDGTFVKTEGVTELHPEPLHGQRLRGDLDLPLGFVFKERTPLLRRKGESLEPCGHAGRMSRFRVLGEHRIGDRKYLEAPGGVLVARDDVRVARSSGRPGYVSSRTRWIHVSLSEQTLVAYLGAKPLFATLVSSGKPGRATPAGHHRLQLKQLSVTMQGNAQGGGRYEVGDVPWSLYYRPLYAIHGAYWHEGFGQVRSHGCINLPPADAFWLFHFTWPVLPAGWHSVRDEGTRVAITP